jgi:hypothetical protein
VVEVIVKLTVGQVVFALLKKNGKLLPARVVEEHIVKTLASDTQFRYMVEFEPGKDPLDVETLDAEVFETAEVATETLLDRTMSTIQKIVAQAEHRASVLFPPEGDDVKQPGPPDAPGEEVGEGIIVEMPDGSHARLKNNVDAVE